MTLLYISATPGHVTTIIGSRADVSTGCPCVGVVWISMRQQGTECCLGNGYHFRSSKIIPEESLCAIVTHSSRLFLHKIDSSNPIATFSVSSLDIIAAPTVVKILPRSISSATSATGIPDCQTHLPTMNHVAKTWGARNFVPGWAGIESLWPGTPSCGILRIRWAFSGLTASSWHSCSIYLLIVSGTAVSTDPESSGSRTSSASSTSSWTSLAPLSVVFSSWMIPFCCSDVSWGDGLIFRCSWNSLQCYVLHGQTTIWTNIYGWNTINSIPSIKTYIKTSIILLPTIILSHISSTLFRTFQSLCSMISSCAHLALTWLAGITSTGLIKCRAITCLVALFILTKSIFRLYPRFILKAFERQQLYDICPYMGSIIMCPCEYDPIYPLSNSSCAKVHLNINVWTYSSLRPPFLSLKPISSSHCPTLVYEARSCVGARIMSLPFDTQQITTVTFVFGNSGPLRFTMLLTHSPKSVTGCCLPRVATFLASSIVVAHLLQNISTHCRPIHSALSKISNCSQSLNVTKKSATAVTQCGGPSRSCSKSFSPRIIDRCFFSTTIATNTFFHLMHAL